MLISFLIFLVSFVALCGFFGYKMYSREDIMREMHYVESFFHKTKAVTKEKISTVDTITVHSWYYSVLLKIEDWAHAVVGFFKDRYERFSQRHDESASPEEEK